MFNWITKGDLEKLLAAGGTSLESVLQQAEHEASLSIGLAQQRMERNRKVIADAQLALNEDAKNVKEASVITRIVRSLGG